MKIKLIILTLYLACCACGSKKIPSPEKPQHNKTTVPDYIKVFTDHITIDVPTKKSALQYSVNIDSTFISLPGFKPGSKPLFSIERSRLLIATSKSDHAYILNLNSKKMEQEFRIREALDMNQGINAEPCDCAMDLAEDLQGLDFYTNNQIILQINFKLLVTNSSGNIVDSIPLKDTHHSPKFIYANISDVPVDYNPLTNKIYIYKYCYDCELTPNDYYSHPFEVGIDAHTKKMTDENLKYPEIFNFFGLNSMDQVYRTTYDHFQYFTFMPDHRIYVYNILNKEMTVHGGQSTHSDGTILTASKLEKDFEKMLEKTKGNDLYFQLVYDDINKRYYRLFIHPNQFDVTSGYFKYDYYVQIFDQDFSLEDEIKFEKGFGAFYFSFGGKLHWVVLKKDGVMLYGYTFKEKTS